MLFLGAVVVLMGIGGAQTTGNQDQPPKDQKQATAVCEGWLQKQLDYFGSDPSLVYASGASSLFPRPAECDRANQGDLAAWWKNR